MRFRRVIVLAVAACVAGVIAVSWWRPGSAPISVRFTRYGSYPSAATAQDLANKTAAFFLISNPGPRTVIVAGGLFAWSPHPYVPTQVRLGTGWTNAEPVPAPDLFGRKLAAGKCCEVPVALGTKLLGPPPEVSMAVAATNVVWRLGLNYERIGVAEQLGLRQFLRWLGNHSPGRVGQWPRALESKLVPRPHRVWSDPVIPP